MLQRSLGLLVNLSRSKRSPSTRLERMKFESKSTLLDCVTPSVSRTLVDSAKRYLTCFVTLGRLHCALRNISRMRISKLTAFDAASCLEMILKERSQ